MTLIVVLDEIIEKLQSLDRETGLLYGIVRGEEDLIQVLSSGFDPGYRVVGHWIKGSSLQEVLPLVDAFRNTIPNQDNSSNSLVLLNPKAHPFEAQGYNIGQNGQVKEVDILITKTGDLLKRVIGIIGSSDLAHKVVLVVGLGSGGSRVALELAKSGVGKLILLDYERLEMDNLIRHMCGLTNVGRFKTRAVRELILNHNPNIDVECYEIDVRNAVELFGDLISKSDLVVAATGSPFINNLTNGLCVKARIPAVFAGVWERATGGFVMQYVPDRTPCFNCIHEFLYKMAPPVEGKVIDYSIVNEVGELKAEPGLSVDIGFIPLLQVKIALQILLKGVQALDENPYNLLIWLNKGYGQYKDLTILKAEGKRRGDCAICNSEGWQRSRSEIIDGKK